MMKHCSICGHTYTYRYIKGEKFYPPVCSLKCFKEWLETYKDVFFKRIQRNAMNEIKEGEAIIISDNLSSKNYENKGLDFILRSKAEAYTIEHLFKNLNIEFQYETKSIYYETKKIMYLPDFFLPDYNVFIEVKDKMWEQGAYKKIKEVSKFIPLYLITPSLIKVWQHNG